MHLKVSRVLSKLEEDLYQRQLTRKLREEFRLSKYDAAEVCLGSLGNMLVAATAPLLEVAESLKLR